MRSDAKIGSGFSRSKRWDYSHGTGGEVKNLIPSPPGSEHQWMAFSHSGHERNRMFLNDGGRGFHNISGVSGADSALDARSFVTWDFNRDGRVDIAVVNANEPLLQIYENRSESANNFISLELTGANRSAGPHQEFSARDAIGARVVVDTGDSRILRVLSAGEGFASQNSKILTIGIGAADSVQSIEVTWPLGGKSTREIIPAGEHLRIVEGE